MNTSSLRSSQLDTTESEIIATRVFDAPRELVFEAWTDPQHIAQWWGPNGFTNTIHSMDVRPGGEWDFIMHGPDGTNYKNRIIYREVVRPERLVYDHVSGPFFHATVTFDEQGDKTRLTVQMLFESAELRDRVAEEFGAVEGLNQTLGRLGTHLPKVVDEHAGDFVITREFDAPRDLVFKAWTEPERLAQWWGPKGFTMMSTKVDLRPGGIFHYGMRGPDGSEMWGKFVYRQIVPPERMVFIVSFSDENGGVTHHPMAPTWPLEMINTLTLTEHGEKTIVTLRGGAYAATEEERATYKAGHKSMQQGFTGTFDQLDAYLAGARS
jgi:uncharacterized protein YndB with AHSA1/START domain